VILPLGCFKNESGEQWHLVLASSVTASGFKARVWVEHLLSILLTEERTDGAVFCNRDGTLISSGAMSRNFILEILKVKVVRPDLVLCSLVEI